MRFTFKAVGFAAPLLLTLALASCAPTPSGGGGSTTTTTTVPPTGAVAVAAGGLHTCALLANGTVTCWGYNAHGQLGTATNKGTSKPNPTPTVVAGLSGVTQITAGGEHTCALLTDHTVECWGRNDQGELGNTTNIGNDNPNPAPLAVTGLSGVSQIVAGELDTCALLTNGTVDCWGRNDYGQLGNATNNGSGNANKPNPAPTAVAGLTGVTQIAAGEFHTCAALSNGTMSCWGDNVFGQLGNATNSGTATPNPTPVAVTGLTAVTHITAGEYHTCAILTNGTVTCWGDNGHGQLGNATNSGSANPNPTPTAVTGLTHVTQITAGQIHMCAVLTNGTMTCWGDNNYGQLGNATNNHSSVANPTPAAVAGLTGVSQITAGTHHTCAALANHTVSCWGYNTDGELGNATNNGTSSPNPTPTLVAGIP